MSIEFFIQHWQTYSESVHVPVEALIACVDLTALNPDDDDATVLALVEHAEKVAALCIAPRFVPVVQPLLASRCALATVANFPSGAEPLSQVLNEIEHSLLAGATEIDVVLPYQAFLMDRNPKAITRFVKACKTLCGPDRMLKTILESGLVEDKSLLEQMALAALDGGSDFLKTSTGKVAQGATLEAAAVLLGAVQAFGDVKRGFKASGGVKTYEQAKAYWLLAQLIMGESWPTPACFRLGASSLLQALLQRQVS